MSGATPEEINLGGITVRFLVEGSASNGSVAVFEFDVRAGSQVPGPHSHDGYEETLYGLRGELTWTVDGERVEVGEGDVLCIRRGVVHRFENNGEIDATALAVVTPGILGPDYFRELAALVAGSAGGPPDLSEIGAIMLRHGLTPARPPASS
jgi:quercetin dioxygenase-like cupin family protein